MSVPSSEWVTFKCPTDHPHTFTAFGTTTVLYPSNTATVAKLACTRALQQQTNDTGGTLSCLGGVSSENRIPPNSVYGRLSRPILIPQDEQETDFGVPPTTLPLDARKVYSLLWDGEFMCTLTDRDNNLIIDVFAGPANMDMIQDRAFHGGLLGVSFFIHPDRPFSYGYTETPFSTLLNNADKEKKQAIIHRTLHRILRSNGFCMPFDFVLATRDFLLQPYLTKTKYVEALDVALIAADIAINTEQTPERIQEAMGKVGEALGAQGELGPAEELRLEEWPKFCSEPDCRAMEKSPQAFMMCPCRTAVYCSKQCQMRHWKKRHGSGGHKQNCPAHRG